MDRIRKATELITRAADLGLTLKFDCGLIGVERTGPGDPLMQKDMINELGKYLREVRLIVESRATAARVRQLLGQRIWSEFGVGAFAGASPDGTLTIAVSTFVGEEELLRSQTLSIRSDGVLMILGEKRADDASSPLDGERKPEPAPKGVFQRLRDGLL